jgi:ribosome biogenesis SPOUT family RNA methylase Rps3
MDGGTYLAHESQPQGYYFLSLPLPFPLVISQCDGMKREQAAYASSSPWPRMIVSLPALAAWTICFSIELLILLESCCNQLGAMMCANEMKMGGQEGVVFAASGTYLVLGPLLDLLSVLRGNVPSALLHLAGLFPSSRSGLGLESFGISLRHGVDVGWMGRGVVESVWMTRRFAVEELGWDRRWDMYGAPRRGSWMRSVKSCLSSPLIHLHLYHPHPDRASWPRRTSTSSVGGPHASPSSTLTSSEHMEEDDESTKALPEWVKLEYSHMLTLTAPNSSVHFTSLSSSSIPPLKDHLASHPQSAHAHAHTEPILDFLASSGIPKERVCLLDPRAPKVISPEDSEVFDVFLYGGILGDDPPRDRTGELRKLGFEGRHLGEKQMTTDTAVGVTKIVIEDQGGSAEIRLLGTCTCADISAT